MSKIPLQIMTVTKDHSTMYVRLPLDFVRRKGIKRGQLMICRQLPGDEIVYITFEDEVQNGPRTDDGPRGKD